MGRVGREQILAAEKRLPTHLFAYAGEKMRRQALFCGENLLASFAADDGLKIADHCGVRMRAEDGAEKIVRGADVGDPVAHGFVDGVFERAAGSPTTAPRKIGRAHV